MKVLMVEYFLPANTYTLELVKELRHAVDLTLFCRNNSGDEITEIVNCKKKMYGSESNKIQKGISYLNGIRWLKKELKQPYDIVHVQSLIKAETEIPIYMNAKSNVRKLAHTVHNILPHEAKESDRKLYGDFYMACDLLIVHNHRSKDQLIFEFDIPEDKISVIPHGIYGDMKPNSYESKEVISFLMFGIVREYKGLDILLNAVALLSEEVKKKCKFVVAGQHIKNFDSNDYTQMAIKLGVEDCVKLDFRRIEDDELPELFENADVCLFPYREIYGSGALLMAYTYQKPVITSNVPTFIEETENGQTGLLFESENPESLAEAIEKFVGLENVQIQEMINNIKRLVDEKYNWKLSAMKTASAYKNMWRNK